MSNKKIIAVTVAVTFSLTCLLNYFYPPHLLLTKNKTSEVFNIIEKRYNGKYNKETLMDYASYAMVAALDDPYSSYLDHEDYKTIMEDLDAVYEGIGIEIYLDTTDNLMTVLAPIEGGPCEIAGILPGDKIIKVDDMEVTPDNYNSIVNYMRGQSESGKKVKEITLSVKRGNDMLSFKVKRQVIELKTVNHIDYDDIAYIRISNFDTPTATDFANVLSSLDKEKTRGIVIDLRDNPGGLLSCAVTIADLLLPKADIVSVKYKTGKKQNYTSDKNCIDIPFTVLTNSSSASASEILAGAIKDNKAGTVIGTKSFGKGCVQELIPLSDEDTAVKLTTALYYTPSGKCIHDVGIEPDITVELSEDAKTKSTKMLTLSEDAQLQKAMAVLREQFK